MGHGSRRTEHDSTLYKSREGVQNECERSWFGIPADAGIQLITRILDSGFHRSDGNRYCFRVVPVTLAP